MSVLFVSGIDTDIGKTYATGLLAKALMQQGVNVMTQKLVQTGISKQANGELGIADDILSHRKLMKIPALGSFSGVCLTAPGAQATKRMVRTESPSILRLTQRSSTNTKTWKKLPTRRRNTSK